MSSTTRGKRVENDDFFSTPAWVVNAILPYLPSGPVLDPCCGEGAILDVARLRNNVETFGIELDPYRANVARAKGHMVGVANALNRADGQPRLVWPKKPKVIIQNPPFSLAEDFVRAGIAHVFAGMPKEDSPLIRRAAENERACAVLLRLAFLESASRNALFRECMPDVYPLAHRPSFAMAVSCVEKKACGWRATLPLDSTRPATCERCGGAVKVNTSDSCAYGWFVFGPGRGGRIQRLEDAPPSARRSKAPLRIDGVVESPKVDFAPSEIAKAVRGRRKRPCLDPEKMLGASDQTGGTDFPEAS